ncbi:MAG: thymidylate synthase, flavin-dependent [Candidatus Harrisonbacteria bacterium RIFCSPLOWO2_02_FULL_41_11]|uniref:FAD-dependent thymidylate synthase n=1 Tax=Candidatus Harrisonbacteria bacterium RIFCSPHIGHO2_02_FULL_42_16 TaxID=1798404 RepID=A0A1G1ZFA4_9BACT|nr:MAG: thymidylate synthase, flavin-dependent [Candidatus Harrisonbacteria bacterium RIFCSPHIGHO2_02_FULL_42_16]OGY67010.1 MAG: thymidylate synthase, flavin-dependent [Candidatus Harrisonbacteria bacterium RIFCSPLOWO2_02_FULL_41_11]
MKFTEPKIYLIGETVIKKDELSLYLNDVGASEWSTDSYSDMEAIAEVMGRLCYRSWKPGLNPNITKVREGNDKYLGHILEVGHGSVLEHGMFNFILANVSRVFTHELVRHRVGVAISQESLRFVRLTALKFWMPSCFKSHSKSERIKQLVVETIEYLERRQTELSELLDLDNLKKFDEKKELTSAMRRLAPIGLATTIGWSVNARTLRHVIEMRTAPGTEEEIRLVFGKIAEKVKARYPNLFQDYEVEMVGGLPWYKTKNKKV